MNVTYTNPATVRDVHTIEEVGMPEETTERHPTPAEPGGMVLLFAVACGVSVANLYYAQPVLDDIARSFGTISGTAGLVVTSAQIGYAAGLALLVPLGDLVRPAGLVPVVLVVTAGGWWSRRWPPTSAC